MKPWALLALVVAAAGAAGSLYLSIGMGLKACPLCFYQRTFVMSVVAVLGVGLAVDRARADLLCLLCLPLSVAGLGVAAFHEYLVIDGALECPLGLLNVGTVPAQSVALFVVLTALLAVGSIRNAGVAAGSVALGLLLAWGCVASAPPMPPPPTKAYDKPLDVCRPPFQP
jgi:hypothetical protein